ncbi:hypothetical protein HDU87_006565 [Geranomyces variabilis]|uniref:Rab-GAP TBC domain-containing protein n=1 Tax=Geranomyces variabilis TaxID=109894 RepID=A0AAD5TFE6_9FUNG|nr:hypothetical protein HDU87_006565 [Geranomyces variabilis]
MEILTSGKVPVVVKDVDSHDVRSTARNIARGLRDTSAFWEFKKLVQRETLSSPTSDIAAVAAQIFNRSGGVGQLLQNHVRLRCHPPFPPTLGAHQQHWWTPHPTDRTLFRIDQLHLDSRVRRALETAQKGLLAGARQAMSQVAMEMDLPLARRRTRQEEAIFMQYAFAARPDDAPPVGAASLPSRASLTKERDPDRACLYDDQHLMDALSRAHVEPAAGTSHCAEFARFWSSIPVDLSSAPPVLLEELAYKYAELGPLHEHIGMDDLGFTVQQTEKFARAKATLGESILARRCLSRASRFARTGVPASLRPQIWDLLLQSELMGTASPTEHAQNVCKPLKTALAQHELLVDHLVTADARQCANDDAFFVFEDVLKEMMLFWIRDEWIDARLCPALPPPSPPPSLSSSNGCNGSGGVVLPPVTGRESVPGAEATASPAVVVVKKYPPNGVLPFWGLSLYAMPVCFIHGDAESAYLTFRELYVRCFHNLHTLQPSAQTPTLPHLLTHFESLLKQRSARLFAHVIRVCGVQPARLAARWLVFAFVGVLDVEQVLLLWDRVLGFGCAGDGIALFAVAAAALFATRGGLLMRARGVKDVEIVAVSEFTPSGASGEDVRLRMSTLSVPRKEFETTSDGT